MGRRWSVALVIGQLVGTIAIVVSAYLDGILGSAFAVFGVSVFGFSALSAFRTEDAIGLLGAVVFGVTSGTVFLVTTL